MGVVGLTALRDVNGNGSPEVALLLVKPDGRGRVYIKDAATTQWVTSVNFLNPDWRARAISSLDLDGDGASEIAVLGVKDDASAAAIQIIDPVTKVQVKWLPLPLEAAGTANRYLDLASLGDANGNGTPDLAALRRNADGSAQVVILDGMSRETINEIAFESYPNSSVVALTGLPDLDGNTAPEVAVFSVDIFGRGLVLVKDAVNGEQNGELVVFDDEWSTVAISSPDDQQIAEIAVLGERDDLSATSVVVFDAYDEIQLDRIPFAPSAE